MFEKAVMSGTKAFAGMSGDDCTTVIRLTDCCEVRAAAKDTAGTAKKANVSTTKVNENILFITTSYNASDRFLLLLRLAPSIEFLTENLTVSQRVNKP